MRKFLLFILLSFLLAGGFVFAYSKMKALFESGEIKTKTEARFSEIFKSRVSIGKIQFKLFRKISFSDLKFDQEGLTPELALKGVKKIVFAYGWSSLIKRSLQIPSDIVLHKPKFELAALDLSKLADQIAKMKFGVGNIPFTVLIEDGACSWPLKETGMQGGVEKVQGRIEKRSAEEVLVHFKGRLTGNLKGEVYWDGKINPKTKQQDIEIRFKKVEHDSSRILLFRNLNGKIRLKNNTFYLEDVNFFVASLAWTINGRIDDFAGPNQKFNVQIRETSKFTGGEIKLQVSGDFEKQTIWGVLEGVGGNYPFRGNLLRDQTGYSVKEVKIGASMMLDAFLLLSDWTTRLKFSKGNERYDIRFSLRDVEVNLDLNADHMQIYDFDLVTMTHVMFRPKSDSWNAGSLVFDARLSTDYFIFNYAPLDDFKGSFVLSSEGIRNLTLMWGKGYKMEGEIIFGKPPLLALDIEASKIVLSETMKFGFHQLPENLSGMMDGKISIRGEAQQPEIQGRLSISSGGVKNLTFDHVSMNFFGNRHYLKLKDSKISKGSRMFYVKGDVDFSSSNIFSGIEVISEDHLPVWRGRDMRMESAPRPSQTVNEIPIAQIERKF